MKNTACVMLSLLFLTGIVPLNAASVRGSWLMQAAQAAASAGSGSSQKVIKDPAEYNAYITALGNTDPAAKAAAMEAFVKQYPNSVVKVDALEQAMAAYQQLGNQAKVEELAAAIVKLEPNNVRALAILTFLARIKATQGNTSAAAQLGDYVERGLEGLKTWQKPEGMTDEDFKKLHDQMSTIFYGAAGFAALQSKDFVTARQNYMKSIAI